MMHILLALKCKYVYVQVLMQEKKMTRMQGDAK